MYFITSLHLRSKVGHRKLLLFICVHYFFSNFVIFVYCLFRVRIIRLVSWCKGWYKKVLCRWAMWPNCLLLAESKWLQQTNYDIKYVWQSLLHRNVIYEHWCMVFRISMFSIKKWNITLVITEELGNYSRTFFHEENNLSRIKLYRHAQIEDFILNKALTTDRLNNFRRPLTLQ